MKKQDGPHSHKVCPRCGIDKPASEFHLARGTASGLAGHCKQCSKELTYEWRGRNPERAKAITRRWYEARGKESHLSYRYQLALKAYDDLLEKQGGVCALCQNPETIVTPKGKRHFLGVDHDHKTGRIRGLLCRKCNTAVERFQDPEVLKRLVAYLAT